MRATVVSTPGPGMGGRCAVSRFPHLPGPPTLGHGIPLTAPRLRAGCLCRSQIWCPLRGVPAIGAHPSGQVDAAHAARHDMPHSEHRPQGEVSQDARGQQRGVVAPS